jgi:anti-sigma factor RsiW
VADHFVGGRHCADVTEDAAAFVLGALEPAEADAIRRHLAGCPEAHAEMAESGSIAAALFETVEIVEPPAALRDRILAAAAAEPQRAPAAQSLPVAQARPDVRPAIDQPRRIDTAPSRGGIGLSRRPLRAAIGIAAALALVALGAWNLQLQSQVTDLTAYRNGVVEVLDAASRPGAQLAVLATPAGASGPSGLAAVATDGSVALVMRDLKPTSGAQVYEAWVIGGDGKPVPIGGFKVGSGGTASFVSHATVEPGITVALTLEPGPDAKVPTPPIIAAGKAQAQAS